MDASREQTFAAYAVGYLIAKEGFSNAAVPELQSLAATCDYVLTRRRGSYYDIVCFVDRERNAPKKTPLEIPELIDVLKSCKKYAGFVGLSRHPVTLEMYDIGPAQRSDSKRSRWRMAGSAVLNSIWAIEPPISQWKVDTFSKTISGGGPAVVPPASGQVAAMLQSLLKAPRLSPEELAPGAAPNRVFPITTALLLAALAATFAIEYFLSFDPITRRLGPSLKTLEMLGGLNWSLVVYSGEWYRLLTAAFLHADPMHFAANAFVLLLAGMILERVVGHAWLAVLFFVSALTGSLASLAWNPIETIGIGSSGAIMGILAAAFVCSFHFHPGSEQTGLRLTAIQVLIPSLLPYFSGKSDVSIDYAAHLGGALGGSVVALIILMTWRPQTPWPSLRTAAAAVSAGFVLMSAASALPIIANYSSAKERATSRSGAPQTQSHYQNYLADLVPAAEWPPDLATQKASVRDLRFRYPNDPRVRYASGLAYLDADDYAAAERELKAALANRTNLASFYGLEESVRSYLSIVLYGQGKLSEARGIAAPLCRGVKSAGQAAVRDLGLCL